MAIYFFIFLFERTFKTVYKTLLPFFHILLTSTNILVERNEMSEISWIFVDMHVICHNRGLTIFLSRPIILPSKLYFVCPWKYQDHLKPLKHLPMNQYLVSNKYFYMVNPCCDVTKTTVNEIKKLSKVVDMISLLQVKIFQELSKI
jgi:hypothetical protein